MSKIYKVLLEREKILVSVPMFWIEISTGIIHQTDKNSDFTSEETKCLTNNFYSRRYISDGSLSKGTNTSQGQPNIFTLKLSFIINIRKLILSPTQKVQFLGMEINSVKMTIVFPQKKKHHILHQ